jgi:DNA polymerase-1
MSCRGPNLQQIPRAPAYRRCFRPGEGRVVVKVDLSTIELCVAAELAGDERMIAAITDGQDLHRLTAAALFGTPAEAVTKEERAFGKTVNFGTLYGQGLTGLRKNALKHGLVLSPKDARRFQARFRQAWPRLAAWQRRQMGSRCREVRTGSGRIRRLAATARGTVRANTPIQGTAADGFKAALALLWQTRSRYPSAVPILAVHDELVMECDAADATGVATWVTECLQRGMQRYTTRVPVRVEAVIAADWSVESS